MKKIFVFVFIVFYSNFGYADNIAYLVTQGLGYTTLSKEFALPYLEDESLIVLNKGQAYNFTPVLTWYNRPEPSDYFTAILDAIS